MPPACYVAAMKRFVVLLGGNLTPTDRLKRQIAGARVIAADGGIRHAGALGVRPEQWVGDFDSTTPELEKAFADVPRDVFPPEKDLTDGELAVRRAFEEGADEVILCGAFGGLRTDHGLQHLTLAVAEADRGRNVWLTSGNEEAHAILPGRREFDLPVGALFSVVGFTDLEGLTITGARWPLDRVHVPFGASLTLSNIVTDKLGVSIEAGRAILIISFAQTAKI